MANSPRWLHLRDQVVAHTLADPSLDANRKTYKAMCDINEQLVDGKPLTTDRATLFINTIRMRLDKSFSWSGPIQLTDNQIKYARRTNSLILPAWPVDEIGVKTRSELVEMVETFQLAFNSLSTHFQLDFNSLSSILAPNVLEKLEKFGSIIEDKIKEDNGAIGTAIAASPISASGATPLSTGEKKQEITYSTTPRVFNPISSNPVTISWWHTPGKLPNANIQIGKQTYHAVFEQYENAEERIYNHSTVEWRQWFNSSLGAEFRDYARGCAGEQHRHCYSALYSKGNTWGAKGDPISDACATVYWRDNEPFLVNVIMGNEIVEIELAASNSSDPKHPKYKGTAQVTQAA